MKQKSKFTIHGAFKSKARAVRKESEVHGFIRRVKMRGTYRYLVLKPRGRG